MKKICLLETIRGTEDVPITLYDIQIIIIKTYYTNVSVDSCYQRAVAISVLGLVAGGLKYGSIPSATGVCPLPCVTMKTIFFFPQFFRSCCWIVSCYPWSMGSRGTVSRVVCVDNKLLWCLCAVMFFWAQKVVKLSVIPSMKILLCSASKSVLDLLQP